MRKKSAASGYWFSNQALGKCKGRERKTPNANKNYEEMRGERRRRMRNTVNQYEIHQQRRKRKEHSDSRNSQHRHYTLYSLRNGQTAFSHRERESNRRSRTTNTSEKGRREEDVWDRSSQSTSQAATILCASRPFNRTSENWIQVQIRFPHFPFRIQQGKVRLSERSTKKCQFSGSLLEQNTVRERVREGGRVVRPANQSLQI